MYEMFSQISDGERLDNLRNGKMLRHQRRVFWHLKLRKDDMTLLIHQPQVARQYSYPKSNKIPTFTAGVF